MQPLTAGQLLAGRYRLVRALGSGTTGHVWLADDVGSQQPVALKFATTDAGAASLQAQFARTRALSHPLIVPLLDECAGPPPFLVMPYLAGGNAGALRGAGFRDVLAALPGVAEALEYAHRQGVVHRDLKASNLLLDERGRCHVSDFAPVLGSLPAMSPQQLAGDAAAVADDVYGFGALLYDLLTGQPLFHPDVSPGRIREETPSLPTSDLAGEPLPPALRALLAGMLRKNPAERPPGLAAVRAAIEDILRDHPRADAAAVIRPTERARAAAASVAPAPPTRLRRGLPAPVVWAGLAALAMLAGLVVFYLPTLVRERGPLVRAASPVAASAPAATPAAPSPAPAPEVPQAALDEALGAFLRSDEELRRLNAARWGGGAWEEVRALAQAADAAYRARDASAALDQYRAADDKARALVARAPAVLAEALRAGEAALRAGDRALAVAQFETALAVAPQDAVARRGLDRAGNLDRVLALMQEAATAEAGGERERALGLYRQAAGLDPAWEAAAAAVARLSAAAARDTFETQMARGLAAQAGGDLATARAAFEAALRVRPGDAGATAALDQVRADEKSRRLSALQSEATGLARKERWAEALQRYEAALAADPNLVEAREGAERARSRAALDARLRAEIGNADRFNDDAVLGKAQALLATAHAVTDPGPVLSGQVAELDRLLAIAVTPVRVVLESDNLTQVTLFKVGRLGAFSSRTLELRPGAYTAVGTRPGYRDVRRNFRVAPGSESAPVVVRCEEPI